MEKLTNNRYYFDHNATSPLLNVVKDVFSRGDVANPSSPHSEGKKAKRMLDECRDYLYGLFGLSPVDFDLFFHSGATEAVNTFVKGFFFNHAKMAFAFAGSDHSCVRAQRDFLEKRGASIYPLSVDDQGDIELEEAMETLGGVGVPLFLNWTWVNNETGVVFDLNHAAHLKEQTGAFVHVDAVQSVGKIKQWRNLLPVLDAYTYSAHKFGAAVGTGFSFLKRNSPVESMIVGGGQQGGLRSGTENVLGVIGIVEALRYLKNHYDYASQCWAKDYLIAEIERVVGKNGLIAARHARHTNGQTVCLVFKKERSDIMGVAFDLAGMDVSPGAACSSGGPLPSSVLLSMGFDDELAKSAIRFSFSPYVGETQMKEYAERIVSVLGRFT